MSVLEVELVFLFNGVHFVGVLLKRVVFEQLLAHVEFLQTTQGVLLVAQTLLFVLL